MKKIFLVEDDKTISKNLMLLFQSEGFAVSLASTQKEAVDMLAENRFDMALVDISLPDGNGFAVCTEIKQTQNIPVIFLTASGDEASVVTGLNCLPASFDRNGLSVDTASGVVKKNGKEVFLSALEYRLLLIFINNPENIITRDRLLDELWDAAGEFVNNNTLTVYIKRLREKIEDDPSRPQLILTVRGTGYRLGGSYVSE